MRGFLDGYPDVDEVEWGDPCGVEDLMYDLIQFDWEEPIGLVIVNELPAW